MVQNIYKNDFKKSFETYAHYYACYALYAHKSLSCDIYISISSDNVQRFYFLNMSTNKRKIASSFWDPKRPCVNMGNHLEY